MQNGKELKHVYARPPAGRGRSLPESPVESPGSRYSRTKSGRLPGPGPGGGFQSKSLFLRLIGFLLSYILRRHAVLLLFPVIYISGMLLYMGNLADEEPGSTRAAPGSVYRSPEVFEKLWPEMEGINVSTGSSFGVRKCTTILLPNCVPWSI